MTKTVMLPRQARGVVMRAESFNEDDNTIEVCWTTGATVQRYSWGDGPYLESLDVTPKAVRLDRLNAGAPFLNTHWSYDLSDVIGSVVPGSARIEKGEGFATIKLSGAAADADTIGKIRDGVIRNVSVGYLVHEVVKTEADDGTMPTWRVTDWEPIEISAVPIPADPGAQVRSDPKAEQYPCVLHGETPAAEPRAAFRAEEKVRVAAIRDVGSKLAIAPAVVEEHLDAGTPLEEFRTLAIDLAGQRTPVSTTAEPAAEERTDPMTDRTNVTGIAVEEPKVDMAAVRAAERARAVELRGIGRKLGLTTEFVDAHVESGTEVDAFRALAIDEAEKRQAPAPFNANVRASDPSQHRTFAEPKRDLPRGTNATRMLVALAACRSNVREAADYVTKHYGPEGDAVARALGTGVGSAGGFLVPVSMADEVIELLRPESAVMALGPRILPMPTGNLMVPRVASGSQANYIGESQPAPVSQPGFGSLQLSAKKLQALVPVSKDMIRFPTVATDEIVRNDMVESIAMRADLAFMRGNGSQFSPRGMRSYASAPSLAGANAIVAGYLVGTAYGAGSQAAAIQALATVTADLSKLELALLNANVKMRKPGWIMAPRSMQYLMNIRDGLGNQVYYKEMSTGMLRGKPFKVTTQVPTNLAAVATDGTTATTDGSEIYLADFAEVFIGEAYGLELNTFDGAAYVDASGTMQSTASNDQILMSAIVQHDFGMRQEAAVAVLTGARWF